MPRKKKKKKVSKRPVCFRFDTSVFRKLRRLSYRADLPMVKYLSNLIEKEDVRVLDEGIASAVRTLDEAINGGVISALGTPSLDFYPPPPGAPAAYIAAPWEEPMDTSAPPMYCTDAIQNEEHHELRIPNDH
jgi:hypothetical protein